MIYLKDITDTTYTLDGHAVFHNDIESYSFHIPYTAVNFAQSLGLKLQEITISGYLATRNDIPFHEINKISFDNWETYQTVYIVSGPEFSSVPDGFMIPFQVSCIVSPLRIGTSHASGIKWGLTSTTLTNSGNYTAYAKLVYWAPKFYFPLTQNLLDFAGASIDFTSDARSYGGVSYPANTPIFDEGLLIDTNSVASIDFGTISEGTLLLKIKYKQGSGARDILNGSDFRLWLDPTNNLIKLTKGANTLSCDYSNTGYAAGDVYFVGIQWDATNTYLAVAKWDNTNKTFESASLDTDTGTFTITLTNSYIGSDGVSNFLNDAISDLIIYPYAVSNWTVCEYNFTLAPLRFNDFYIANITSGTITYENGTLIDEDGNDITGLVSGSPLTEGTIEMTEGLSARWEATVYDTYFP